MVRSRRGWVLGLFAVLILEALPRAAGAQAVMGTGGRFAQIVIFPSPNVGLPNPAINVVPGLPSGAFPHGVSYYGSDNALVGDAGNFRIFVIQVSTATDRHANADADGHRRCAGERPHAVVPDADVAGRCSRPGGDPADRPASLEALGSSGLAARCREARVFHGSERGGREPPQS